MSSILNRKAVKQYALALSAKTRAGKFKRVSKQFIDSVEADILARLRTIPTLEPTIPEFEKVNFVKSKGRKVAVEELQKLARKIIISKVQSHPSLGVTLK